MIAHESFVDVLRSQAETAHDRRVFTFLEDGERVETTLTYGELDRRARQIGALLQASCARGARVVLLYPPGLDYVTAFFGCLYAGAVAVPAYPPDPSRLPRTLPRLQAIVADADAATVLTTSSILSVTEGLGALAPELSRLTWLATDALADSLASDWRPGAIERDTLAFLQYTSGSTGTPKGVMLTHGNLLANEAAIQALFRLHRESVGVGWLPLYHDMGLIGNVLQTVHTGFHCVLLSPLDFLQKPLRWLEAISRYGGTTSGGPNFAYDLCVRKVGREERERLDLRTWTVAFCGAEPVRRESLDRFAEAFAPSGFRQTAFLPCYGLAEATLLVSGKPDEVAPRVARIDGRALATGRVAIADGADGRAVVGCGPATAGTSVRIVDPVTREVCAADRVGEIWVHGPSVALGYWADPARSEETFRAALASPDDAVPHARFLRTGDLGFIHEGELFVSGRLKDLIIVRGRNHYPQDIERAVEASSPTIRQGATAAFSVETDSAEALVVVAEVVRLEGGAHLEVESVFDAIRRAVAETCDLHLDTLVLVRPGSIAKTSSGKIQRHACKAQFLEGTLDVVETRVAADDERVSTDGFLTREVLDTAPPEARLALVERFVLLELARVLRIAPARIDSSAPLRGVGLDSLMAVEVSHAIERRLDVVLPATLLLKGRNAREVAREVADLLASPRRGRPSSRAADEGAALGLSGGQESLWFLHELTRESGAYNLATAFDVEGELDVKALTAAFRSLLAQHPALRTTFGQVDGALVQRPRPDLAASFVIDVVDATSWTEDEVHRRAGEIALSPFDIERGPVLRAALLSRGSRRHVLVVSTHHIAADLWSVAILLSDLREAYARERRGETSRRTAPRANYGDFVAWERAYLERAGDTDLAYWRSALADVPVLELPTDRPRPAVQTYHGGAVPVRLSESQVVALGELARAQGTTPYVVLLTAFQILLARYSQQEDFAVGSPVSGRPGSEFERTVGYFINALPMRADLRGEPTTSELVHRTREVVLAALEHQHYPFARAVDRLSPVRDASRMPFFQTVFVLEKAPSDEEAELALLALQASAGPVDLDGLELRSFALPHATATYDLRLSLAQGATSLEGFLEYNADLFDRSTVERMAAHFANVLDGVLARPDAVIWELPLLTDAERCQLLVEWQGERVELASDRCAHELFEEHVRRTPEAVAIQCGTDTLTYAELNRRANQLARWLQRRGVGIESRVVLWLERSLEIVVAAVAVAKAGASYVQVDPAYPAARVEFTVKDAGARVLLSTRAIAQRWPEGAASCLDDDALVASLALENADDLGVPSRPENALSIVYTSGTTGQPKGVVVEHRNWTAHVRWAQLHYELVAIDRFSHTGGPSFDLSILETWLPLLTGASIHTVDEETRLSSERFRDWLVAQRITMAFLPTPIANQLLEEDRWEGSVLRCVTSGGDRLSRRPSAAHPFVFKNVYGPCECTIFVTADVVEPDLPSRPTSIGRPITGASVYVLDRHLQPVPVGVPGELVIGGDYVGREYLSRPELTAAKFVRDPFRGTPGARMYRTGDVGRFTPDGKLEFLGRRDHQIKLRGLRVELGEIENALLRHATVREAVVVAREDAPGRVRLAAYVTSAEGATAAPAVLTEHLRAELPEYMVPSAIVTMNLLPLTPNGKVDRRALPAPDAGGTEREYVAPRDSLEERIARIVAEVLGVPRIGAGEKFFDAGASSIDLVNIQRRIERELGVRLPMATLFERASIDELAAHLRSVVGEQAGTVEHHPVSAPTAARSERIAIIGMAGRFPGAANIAELWENVLAGRDCISRFDRDAARPSFARYDSTRGHFVGAEGVLAATGVDPELWRPSADTRGLDVQSSLFLDCVLAAFEDGGHDPWDPRARVALYGGASTIPLVEALLTTGLASTGSGRWAQMALAPEMLPMKAAHTFGFRAEAIHVNTACSTGLAAVHLACRSLVLGSSDLAVAVAASVPSSQGAGYVHEDGTILSADGRVRPFDASASGTVIGHGVAAVLLKPLDAALRDGDAVYAVIRATAMNNDGRAKVGFTAPGVTGQVDVITAAHTLAGLAADEIAYVEAHGTGTRLGDPIELAALTSAFRRTTSKAGYCALGAIKANIGHLDSAAGLAGLVKTALALQHETIPPLANFEAANPELELADSPFVIPQAAQCWPRSDRPRVAGVSSFGIGGTNVHAIVEEAPARPASTTPARPYLVLQLHARTEDTLARLSREVAERLEAAPLTEAADLVFTLNTRRLTWPATRAVVGTDGPSLARALRTERSRVHASSGPVRCAFVYAGMGSSAAGAGALLYNTERVFREHVDACDAHLAPAGFPVRRALVESANAALSAGLSGAALFTFETALTRLLGSWGLRPALVVGHSFGEYAAATCAGVATLEDALELVIARCRAMDAMPEGAMLVATCPSELAVELARRADVEIAAVNGPNAMVFTGAPARIDGLKAELRAARIPNVRLAVDRALHSKDVEAVLPDVLAAFAKPKLRTPSIPFVSTVTGAEENERATTPAYWAEQMRCPVRFAEAIGASRAAGANVFVEIGPTGGLVPVVAGVVGDRDLCLSAHQASSGGASAVYELVARLLERGASVDWTGFFAGETRRRVSAPLHPRPAAEAATGPETTSSLPRAPLAPPAEPTPREAQSGRSIEDRIAALWRKALVLESVDRDAHFLELGGSSLLAVQMVASLRDEFAIEMALTEVFSAPTLAQLAALVASKLDTTAPASATAEATPTSGVVVRTASPEPASAASAPVVTAVQRRVLAAAADERWDVEVVNMVGAVRLRGPLDQGRLARALSEVVRRHEVLHTRFARRDGVVGPQAAFRSSDVQLTSVWCEAETTDARLAEVRAAIGERLGQRFDLAREIPVRPFLFHVGAEDHVLALVIHHMAVDAPSLKIVLEDTIQRYLGAPLTDVAPRYSTFAARQEASIAGGDGTEHVTALNGLIDRSPRLRAMIETDDGPRADASLSLPLDAGIGKAVVELRRRHGLSTFVVVATALSLVFRDLLRTPELFVTTPYGNRERPEHQRLVGYVAHCMMLHLRLDAAPSSERTLAEVQRAFEEALRHASVPFEHCTVTRSAQAAGPFSDACVVVYEERDESWRMGELEIAPFACETEGETGAPVWAATMGSIGTIVRLRPDGSGGSMTICFPRALLASEAATIPRRMSEALDKLLGAADALGSPMPTSISAVRGSATRSPLALRLDGVALSHAEVGSAVAVIEAELRARGVGPTAVVDVVHRSRVELVCGAIAVLRLGAHATVGRADAPFSLGFEPDEAAPSRIVVSLDLPRGRRRSPRFDPDASPITQETVARAANVVRRESGTAHLVWDGQLPDNRALALALATIEGDGLVSDVPSVASSIRTSTEAVPLSLAYFPVDEESYGVETYGLLLEGAKLADASGLRAVFAPERHFHPFGGTYPDPLVAAAALATATSRIELRAGSIVLPLHDPIRVAESWGMVDVLSNGRVGLSIATGWRAEDFVLAPQMFARRKDGLTDLLETLRALWRGESVERVDPEGRALRLRTRPRPIQPELPVWLTCAGSPASFALAGELGTSVLTMITTDVAGVAENIRAYRASFAKHWDGATGHVTVLVSTFVHENAARAREIALEPLERYLSWSLDIGMKESSTPLSPETRRRFLRQKAERVIESDGLIGDFAQCSRRLESFVAAGADEIACLVDFGIDKHHALRGIEALGTLAERAPSRSARSPRLPAPVPLEHRGRHEVWLLSKAAEGVAQAPHRTVLVEDDQLHAETAESLHEHPLSAIQFGIYFDELRFAKPTYNNPFIVRRAAPLDADRLREAIAAVSRRHDMLRSRFVTRGERLVRVVDPAPKVDLRVLYGCEGEAAAVERAVVDAATRFDLGTDHPLRVFLYPSGSGPCHLLLCLHHVAGDVVSGFLVLRDMLRAYDALPADPWAGAPPPPSYAHVAALRDRPSEEREGRLRRWLAHIDGAPSVVEWPTTLPRPSRLSGGGAQLSRVLSRERVDEIRAAARRCKVTIPTFLFTVFQALLHVKTRRRDLLVGAVTLGRNNPAWLEVVGPLFSMLPVRSTLEPGRTFEWLAQRTSKALVETIVEDQIGFAEIVQRGGFSTTLERSPLLQFLFNYVPKDGTEDGSEAGITQIDVDWGTATFDVDFSARERGDELVLTAKWSVDALDARAGAGVMTAFDELLSAVVRRPDLVLLRPDAPELQRDSATFWRTELAGAPSGVGLLLDGPKQEGASGRVERSWFELSGGEALRVREVARKNDSPPSAVYLAAFAAVLFLHSGEDDLALACGSTTAAERALEAACGGPGGFTMVRLRADDAPSFDELVVRAARGWTLARAHEPLPPLGAFGPAGSDGRVGVTFTWIESDDGALDASPPVLGERIALALEIAETERGARAAFMFDTAAITQHTIERLARRFLTLVASAVADPTRPLSKLALLPAEEATAMDAWNATDASYPRDLCVHELIAAQARRSPDAIAVVDETSQLTYADLDARAERLALRLRRAGVGVEIPVALALGRSATSVVALLAVQKAGGTYLPVDLELPTERIRAMLEDAGVRHVVAEGEAVALAFDAELEVVRIDIEDTATEPAPPSPPRATPDNLAYVMFTSGSTGRPKGVQVTHRALVNFLESMRREPGIGSTDVLLALTTLSFDISGLEIYLPLVAGARVVIAPRAAAMDGKRLGELLASSGATIVQATPTTFRLLFATGWKGSPTLKVLVGGEAVPADLVRELVPCCASVWNMYGPTETTIWSTCARLDGGPVVIGRPIANTQAYVLGPDMKRVPVGVKGELYLGGDGLARGYVKRPDLTADRFVPNPFADGRSLRLYRTGDIARYLVDGNIECLGRTDSQIKLRGFRIELGEVEHALTQNPAVRAAVVLAREDRPGDKRLVAFVVARSRTGTLSAKDLAEHLKAVLPAYMVPSAFVVLDVLPLNPSGKVDRKALAAMTVAETRATAEEEAPSGDLEVVLAQIWSEVLGVPNIGRNDNFFDLGGSSLLALQVHGKLVAALGKDFPILNLFTYTTLSSLASYLSGTHSSVPTRTRTPATREALLERGTQRRAQRGRRAGGRS